MIEKDNSMVIVPTHIKLEEKLIKYASLTLAIFAIVVTCVLFRRLFNTLVHEKRVKIGQIIINTWGALLLANTSERIRDRPGRVLHTFFVIFAMVFSMLAGAILLGNILTQETQTNISTLKELAESKMPICISRELNQFRSEWSQGLE